ncbi:MAG: M23 family metallopeptidase [Clostridiales bacterium]|jgi:peptidase M23|nr:M23 family metallopeptidase [Clostridiales bacterium]MBF0988676.1 M23 family metallopeptidase [Clostridiales bacterium]
MEVINILRVKKLAVGLRKSIKLASIAILAAIVILSILQIAYSQTYEVSLNGKVIGYTRDKVVLQKRINDYINSGNGDDVAFVEVDTLPTYKAVLLKRNIKTNDEEILNKVVESGIAYYKYYAIAVDNQEKAYLKTFGEAEKVIQELKNKKSTNADSLGIVEKYAKKQVAEKEIATQVSQSETKVADTGATSDVPVDSDGDSDELPDVKELTEVKLASVDDSINQLYVQQKSTSRSAKNARTSSTGSKSSTYEQRAKVVDNSQTGVKTDLGVTLIKPISSGYTITSRFGWRSRDNHPGLDVAAPKGTAIKAAAGGTVIFAGSGSPYGGYGNIVVIQSNSSTAIRYAHCSKIYVRRGEVVEQGQVIAAVGSTGISTGNHLHFEIRYNGKKIDPQKYVY